MRILVCGGREYFDEERVSEILNYLHRTFVLSEIIQGGANGADYLALLWARRNNILCSDKYAADWKTYGKRAGFIRNAQMLAEGKPNQVVAFPGGRGTADMIRQAESAGFEVWKVF